MNEEQRHELIVKVVGIEDSYNAIKLSMEALSIAQEMINGGDAKCGIHITYLCEKDINYFLDELGKEIQSLRTLLRG